MQIVEPVIAVDRRYDRHAERRAEQRRRQIGAAAVAADEIEPAGANVSLRRAKLRKKTAGERFAGDAALARVVGEHAAAQTQKLCLAGFVQLAEQPEHMGARAPGVAAADEMYGFHGGPPMTADKFRSLLSCPAGADCGILTLT